MQIRNIILVFALLAPQKSQSLDVRALLTNDTDPASLREYAVFAGFSEEACKSKNNISRDWHVVPDDAGGISIYSKFMWDDTAYEGHFTNFEWNDINRIAYTNDVNACISQLSAIAEQRIIPIRVSEPPPAPEVRSSAIDQDEEIGASRIFAGPSQYPPEDFLACGILAFRARVLPTEEDQDRHLMLCRAYVSVIPHSSEFINLPLDKQMVTVWPVDADEDADRLNWMPREKLCQFAINNYGLVASQKAIRKAQRADLDISGAGPYLLAWSPASEIGNPNNPVLVADLSDVTHANEAQRIFTDWVEDIERDPLLWEAGFNLETVRVKIRQWADKYGRKILYIINAA